jgi:hypothetical protein
VLLEDFLLAHPATNNVAIPRKTVALIAGDVARTGFCIVGLLHVGPLGGDVGAAASHDGSRRRPVQCDRLSLAETPDISARQSLREVRAQLGSRYEEK